MKQSRHCAYIWSTNLVKSKRWKADVDGGNQVTKVRLKDWKWKWEIYVVRKDINNYIQQNGSCNCGGK